MDRDNPSHLLRWIRDRLGLSTPAVADLLGLPPEVVARVEEGGQPTPDVAGRLAALRPPVGAGDDLLDAFADPVLAHVHAGRDDIRAVAAAFPDVARAFVGLFQSFRRANDENEALRAALAERGTGADPTDSTVAPMGGGPSPAEEVSIFLQKHRNHFPLLEDAAQDLWLDRRLEGQNLYRGLVRTLMEVHGVLVRVVPAMSGDAVRRYEPEKGRLMLSEEMPPRTRDFQLACQVGLLGQGAAFDQLLADPVLGTDAGRTLGRIVLANYFAGAVLMPHADFRASAVAFRYDVERLGHRFRSSFEQVCHRLSTLAGAAQDAVPFHMVRVDVAGNISKRYSGSGIRFPRFNGSCPRWNVYRAFATPGQIRVQVSEMPDGSRYFTVACTVRKHQGGYLQPASSHAIEIGCRLEHARALVYSEGVDLTAAPVPVGVACRVCPRTDCDQRAFPAIDQPLRLNPDARARSMYTRIDP